MQKIKKQLSVILTILLLTITIKSPTNAQNLDQLNIYNGVETYTELYKNVNLTDVRNHWSKDSVYKMSALSIIRGTGQGLFSPDRELTKQEALTLVIRLRGLEAQAQTLNPSDWLNGYIELALAIGILSEQEILEIQEDYETQNLAWEQPAKREKVANWIGKSIGLRQINGSTQQAVYNFNDWEIMNKAYIPMIEAVLQEGIMSGDTSNQFNPKSPIKRSEMARILDNAHKSTIKKQGYTINTGVIESRQTKNQTIENQTKQHNIIVVKNHDNSVLGLSYGNEHGFIVYKDGRLTTPNSLNTGEHIRYYINKDKKVVYVETIENQYTIINGYIQEINNEQITIKDYNNQTHKYDIIKDVDVSVNEEWTQIKNLLYDQHVKLKVASGKVVSIEAELDQGQDGYIHPGERVELGKVLYIDKRNSKLTTTIEGTQQEYLLDPSIPIIKNNQNIGINGIREGDEVRLEFDQYTGNTPMRVHVLQPERQITNIYRGTITHYNPSRNQIIINNPSYYNHATWQSQATEKVINLERNAQIYINGQHITKELLNNYIGREVYLALGDSFGREEAVKLVLKSGYEKNYQNTIQAITFGDRKITLDYQNIYYDNSTIVVKDGRLVDPYNIRENDDVFLASHGLGETRASFISIEGTRDQDIGIVVYRGEIEDIAQYEFDLYRPSVIDGLKESNTRRRTIKLNEDTKIIDTRNVDTQKVTVKEFTDSRFLKDKDREEDNYYEKQAYVISQDGVALAINVIDKNTEHQTISIADIEKIKPQEEMITLRNVRDWSQFRDRWNINTAQIELELSEAVFIKNSKPVNINEIRETDSLYIMRRNDKGYIIVVR